MSEVLPQNKGIVQMLILSVHWPTVEAHLRIYIYFSPPPSSRCACETWAALFSTVCLCSPSSLTGHSRYWLVIAILSATTITLSGSAQQKVLCIFEHWKIDTAQGENCLVEGKLIYIQGRKVAPIEADNKKVALSTITQ